MTDKSSQHLATKTCPLCGNQFLPTEEDSQRCSDACRTIAAGGEPSQQQVSEASRARQISQPKADPLL